MDNSEKLALDAKQRHLAKLKKKLAKHERKLERSLRVSQAKEHVRKKLKEQAFIEAAENQSLIKENLSFDSVDDQSFNHSCFSPFVSKNSDVTVVDLSKGDLIFSKDSSVAVADLSTGNITLSDINQRDITLPDINQGDRTPLNTTSGTATPQKSKESVSCMKDGLERRKTKSKDEAKKSRNSSPIIGTPIPTSLVVLHEDQEKLKDPYLAKGTPIRRELSPLAVKTPLTTTATSRSKDRRLNDTDSDKILHKTSSKKCERSLQSEEHRASTTLTTGTLTPRSKDRQLKVTPVIENERITHKTSSKKHDSCCLSEDDRTSTPLTPTSINKDRQLKDTPVVEYEGITDRTLSKKQDGGRHSEEYRTSFKDESRSVTVDKKSPRMERSVTAMAVRKDSPNLNMKVLDELTNQRQRKDCSDVLTISKKMQSPSNKTNFLNAKNASFTNDLPSPTNVVMPNHQTHSSSYQKRSPGNQKPSPTNHNSFTNHMTSTNEKPSFSTNQKPSPGNKKTVTNQKLSTNQKPSPGNHKTQTNQKFSTNQKPSPGNHKTQTNQKSTTITRTMETSTKQKTSSIQKPSQTNQTPSASNQKTSPSNQKSRLDDSGISQSSLEISRTSFLNDSLSLTPTFGDDGCDESRRKVNKPQSENELQDQRQTLHFQASEIDFSGLESCDIEVRVQNKNSAKSYHEVSNFDTIEFISQTKSATKPKVNVPDDHPSVNLQQTSKRKPKESEHFKSVTETSFDSRSKRKTESVAMPDLKSASTKDLDSNSEKISENLFQKDEDVQILSQGDLNFGIMEGMDPDLPILIIDRKSKRRSRSRHKSTRQTSSPILSQKELGDRSIKISTSGAKRKSGADSGNRSSKTDKWREIEMHADTLDPQQTNNKRIEIQSDRRVQYVDGDITEVSESDSQRSVSILVDTSKSLSSSCILDEKISVIESGDDDFTLVSPKSDEHSSKSLLKSSKKHSLKDCVSENDFKTKSPRNSTANENINENSCNMVSSYNPGDSSSQEKNNSQNSHLSDSLSLKRRKFKQRKRSLSHRQDGSESLGSSQDSKRIKVSETSQDSSSMNSAEESINYKLSSKSSRRGNKNNQESIKCKIFEKQEASSSSSQKSNMSSNRKTAKHPETSTATKNVTLDTEQNGEMSQYSEYTELDVVEFSQFKFSEEFLTEGSENSERGRKRKRHPSHLGMIVQRRSPRVASLADSESSSNSCSDKSHHRMTRREKCLIISSVFQYLIDEIKRELDIKEFKLPDSQFKDLVDVKILENNFELDDDIPVISAVKTALCAKRQESPKYNNSDSSNLENYDITSREIRDTVTCDKCDSSKVDKCDDGPFKKCDVHDSVKSSNNENSVSDVLSSKICLNSKESKDTNSEKRLSETEFQIQNFQKLKQSSQSSASAFRISEGEKSKQRAKLSSASDINVIYDSEPIDENFVDSDEESTTSKARYENLTTDYEIDIKVIYDSEPVPDDSMSEEKCYHRNDATDLQDNDLSTISEKSMKENSTISDNFEEKENKNFEDDLKRTENNEQGSLKAKNLESVIKGDKSDLTKIVKSSAMQPEQVETFHENLDDSEVTFKNNIQLPISTPKFSAKLKRGQSKSLFRNSTSTPKCPNLAQTPKTPNLDELKSSTPKTNSKLIGSVSNVESFETPKTELSKFAEKIDAYTTPKDANIRRHFNFADDNLSPPLFPTQKDLTPIGIRRLEDETLDSFIQIDDDETECDGLIGPTDCIKLCREESVVFISGGTWTSDGQDYSYIVCLLPSAISVWSQCQGQWENELDWYLSQTYQAIEGWIIKKPNKVVLVILEEDKTGEQRVLLFYYDLLSGDSNMAVIDLHLTQTNPVTSLLCCIVNEDQLIIGYNHCTSLSATKHLLIDGYKQMSLCCHLESTSGYLMDLAEVKHLECCAVGLTSKREALIWNHEAGFLIKKINLESVITPGVSLTSVHNIQGYLVCHLLYRVKSDSPGYVVIVNISNNSSLILHDYPCLQFAWKGLKNAAISGDTLLASDIQGNTGLWDMVSGELLADIPRSKVSSGNINQSDQTLYLGLDGGAVHVYPMENINLKN